MARAQLLLRVAVSASDRRRFAQSALIVLLSHASIVTLLSWRDNLLSLLCLLSLLIAQRTLLVKVVGQALPLVGPRLSDITRTRYVLRGAGSVGVGCLLLLASFTYGGALLQACPSGPMNPAAAAGNDDDDAAAADEAAAAAAAAASTATCAPASCAFSATWAALIGLVVAVEYALGGAEMPGSEPIWPLLSQPALMRVRPALPAALANAVRSCVQYAGILVLATWLLPSRTLATGASILNICRGCPICADAPLLLVPGARELGVLLVRGIAFRFCCSVLFACVRISYTQPLGFAIEGRECVEGGEAVLEAAMSAAAHPLTQHLAYHDAAAFSQHDASRRHSLFGIERGSAWPRHLKLLLRPIDTMTVALDDARKGRGASPTPPVGPFFVPRGALLWAQQLQTALVHRAVRASIDGSCQLAVWACDAVSCLIAASAYEDAFGAVQLSASLDETLTSLLRCMQALESYCGAGVGAGGSASAQRLQPLAAVSALGAAAAARASGDDAAGSAALGGALMRATYVIVHGFGERAVLAAKVPSELRPRLEAFVGELF